MKKILSLILALSFVLSISAVSFATAGVANDHLTREEREIINKLYPNQKLTEAEENRAIKQYRSEEFGEAKRSGTYGEFEKRLENKEWDRSYTNVGDNVSKTATAIKTKTNHSSGAAEPIAARFSRYFSNELVVVEIPATNQYYNIPIAFKNPVVYTYDTSTNIYKQVPAKNYSVKADGTVTVDNTVTGIVVLSNGELAKK